VTGPAGGQTGGLEELADRWGIKYLAIVRLWRNAGGVHSVVLDYDPDSHGALCSTNAIESLTARYRRAVRAPRALPTKQPARSHARATEAIEKGRLGEESTVVPGADLTDDEGVRPGATVRKLADLKPALARDGTITAGSASQLSDGACAVVAPHGRAPRPAVHGCRGSGSTSWRRTGW
jgi:hypothetical protein